MRTLKEQIESRCVHFTGVQNDTCKAGIKYAQFRPMKQGLPCIKFRDESPPLCDRRESPTPEAVQKEINDWEALDKRFQTTLPIIERLKREHKGQSWRGVEPCPICGKNLHLSIAGYNGHVHGRCETDGCLNWME